MTGPVPRLERFLYSHHLFAGVRQALGVILPPVIIGSTLGFYQGLTAAIGAACVAIVDQAGGPRRYGERVMAAAVLIGSITVALTGLSGLHPALLWLIIPLLCFVFSMFTVFGKQGGLLGFACLLIMTLTLRVTPSLDELWRHVAWSLLGSVSYFLYSTAVHRIFWHQEERQTLAEALFATADYMKARASLYDTELPLDVHYRRMVQAQLAMTESQQAARDTVLRELPTGDSRSDRDRVATLNLFIDMVALLDTLVATHTDYVTLRENFKEADVLLFPRDALHKLSANLERIAFNVARKKRARVPHSIKPELRALEFELRELKEKGFVEQAPEVYALLLQVLRRLRRANDLILRMAENTRRGPSVELVDRRLDHALDRFLSRRKWRLGMLTSNLRLDSPHFRYAVRVTVAATVALALSRMLPVWGLPEFMPDWTIHDYWVLLTILVIMKPGYALTRQRNGWRLAGTLLGCGIALVVFNQFESPYTLFGILTLSAVLWYALLQVHFMFAAAANTVFVLLAFHFSGPQHSFVIGERIVDTLLASGIALLCSHYILPWWESNYMASLADALRRANLRFLRSGLKFAELKRELNAASHEAINDAELQWRVDRKNMHIAFSNYVGAFYRMMAEPVKRQWKVKTLNALMIQHHTLASHISASIPLLAEIEEVPPDMQAVLDAIVLQLANEEGVQNPPLTGPGFREHALLAYPLRQMQSAATLINALSRNLNSASETAPPPVSGGTPDDPVSTPLVQTHTPRPQNS